MARKAKHTSLMEVITTVTTEVLNRFLMDCSVMVAVNQEISASGDNNVFDGNKLSASVRSLSSCQGSAENMTEMQDEIFQKMMNELDVEEQGFMAGLTSSSTYVSTEVKTELSRILTNENLTTCIQALEANQKLEASGDGNVFRNNEVNAVIDSTINCINSQISASAVLSKLSTELEQHLKAKNDSRLFGGLFDDFAMIGVVVVCIIIMVFAIKMMGGNSGGGFGGNRIDDGGFS